VPEHTALSYLRESRDRFGWQRPTDRVPATEEETLATAGALLQHDALVLDGWQAAGQVSAAIPVHAPGEPVAALAIAGPSGPVPQSTVVLWLQEGRRRVEAALRE
jgi:DNA-binding IclR family transcriptional regulator